MIAIRQRQMVSCESPKARPARRHESGCGAAIMSRTSATIRSGLCTRAIGVSLRPDQLDQLDPQPEQRHRCAPVRVPERVNDFETVAFGL
jgi:hypothetical protein